MRTALVIALLLTWGTAPGLPAQAGPDTASLVPVQRVTRLSVIAFWRVPASDSVLEANPDLASALDDQQYYWANTRPLLQANGISALDQPGRVFIVQEPRRRWRFAAAADSAAVGYLLVAPGRTPRVLYGRQFPDELLAAARAFARTAPVRRQAGRR
jgi:hypothetical protein